MKKLNIENPFFEFMNGLADLVVLNIIWILSCLPFVTIGPAKTALYRVMLRRARGESNYPVREYLEAFKEDFGKSCKIWLVLLISGGLLVFDLMYMGRSYTPLGILVGVLLFVWMILESYLFPLTAQFENNLANTWKNAAYMAVRHFPYTVIVVILNGLPLFCFLAGGAILQVTLPIYLVIGFSLTAGINARIFRTIFARYM